jgi:RNA polymerase sigma factor (sigma-70 family)
MRRPSNTDIFSQLYDEFMPKVFAYIHYRINDEQTTEDLTSIVFEKALVNFTKYSSDKAAFSTWIFTIARNSVIDHFRTDAKRHHIDLDDGTIDVPSTAPSPEEQMERQTEKDHLLKCLSKLGDPDREIVRLKFGAEMTNRQISKMLNLTESNVGVRLFRAVKRLRSDFEESWNG